jgi:glycine/sarcosine/betaine reductase complex component A
MDLEVQGALLKAVDEHGKENVVVILGSPDVDSCDIFAETVTVGDPTYAGPLAGVELKLNVYHILEDEVKELIPEEVYQEQVGIMELSLDKEGITEAMKNARKNYLG